MQKNCLYQPYSREKYAEIAKSLRIALQGLNKRIPDVNSVGFWSQRHLILDENRKLIEDKKNGTVAKLCSLEDMAKDTDLSFLYNTHYRNWSYICHCNMASENFIFKNENHNNYMMRVLQIVNHCIYKILSLYASELHLCENDVAEFKNKHSFHLAFDYVTGMKKNVADVAMELFDLSKHGVVESDLPESTNFYNTSPDDFKAGVDVLEKLIKDIEDSIPT